MANILTVSALNRYVKSVLESDELLVDIAIKGEVSNFNRHYKTGHCYFSIKDNTSSVSAVMFRSDAERLAFSPENGMAVIARCRVSLYERDGRFQIYVQDLFPDGMGAAQMAFEQLKARLAAEGLFDEEYKKPLPAYPRRVGLVTSKTGAALQDILKVASRRCPDAHFLLAPVTVQGAAAAPEIAEGIRRLDVDGNCDAIIVARGGGSAEDLWVFNAEAIARAVFACKTPVVSAIGHEIDFTIVDFVADVRAPTPSAAAEIVLPDLTATCGQLLNLYANIADNIHSRLDSCYNKLTVSRRHPTLAQVAARPAKLRELSSALSAAIARQVGQNTARARQRFAAAADLTASVNPYAILARGYAVASKNGTPLRSVDAVQAGDSVLLTLADGTADCTVEQTSKKRIGK